MTVRDILNAKGDGVITVTPDDTIAALAAKLMDDHIGAAIVSSDGRKIEGIVSERDLLRGVAERQGGLGERPVRDFMSDAVATCSPNDTADSVIRRMLVGHLRHMPVVDRGEIAGIVSLADLVKFHLTIS